MGWGHNCKAQEIVAKSEQYWKYVFGGIIMGWDTIAMPKKLWQKREEYRKKLQKYVIGGIITGWGHRDHHQVSGAIGLCLDRGLVCTKIFIFMFSFSNHFRVLKVSIFMYFLKILTILHFHNFYFRGPISLSTAASLFSKLILLKVSLE